MISSLKALGPKHAELYPSFAPPETWRTAGSHVVFDEKGAGRVVPRKDNPRIWEQIRVEILERDNYACRYCGFQAFKWQIVHHIDGNPDNNDRANLETICPMCNLVLHCGRGVAVLKTVDLYQESTFSQAEVIQMTRVLRASGHADDEIIMRLGLTGKVRFRQDRAYLQRLVAFVSAREPARKDFMIKALAYGYDKAGKLLQANRRKTARKVGSKRGR